MKEREGVKAKEAEDVICCSRKAGQTEGGDLGKVRLAYMRFGTMTEHIVADQRIRRVYMKIQMLENGGSKRNQGNKWYKYTILEPRYSLKLRPFGHCACPDQIRRMVDKVRIISWKETSFTSPCTLLER